MADWRPVTRRSPRRQSLSSELIDPDILLWAAFPKADEVHSRLMDGGTKVGIGIRFGDQRHALRFDPDRVKLADAIAQLEQRVFAN